MCYKGKHLALRREGLGKKKNMRLDAWLANQEKLCECDVFKTQGFEGGYSNAAVWGFYMRPKKLALHVGICGGDASTPSPLIHFVSLSVRGLKFYS